VPDNAFVDEMKLSVRARADDAARIEDLVTRPELQANNLRVLPQYRRTLQEQELLEVRSPWARLDDACRVVADHFCSTGRGARRWSAPCSQPG
jgi:hypothetical protein